MGQFSEETVEQVDNEKLIHLVKLTEKGLLHSTMELLSKHVLNFQRLTALHNTVGNHSSGEL